MWLRHNYTAADNGIKRRDLASMNLINCKEVVDPESASRLVGCVHLRNYNILFGKNIFFGHIVKEKHEKRLIKYISGKL